MKKTVFILLISLITAHIFAQDTVPEWKKAHFLSAEEMKNHNPASNLRDFFITAPPPAPVRQIAEFERMQSVLVRYPFGIPLDMIAEISQDCGVTTIVSNLSQENQVRNMYLSNGVDIDNCDFMHAPSDSYWTRDYGPWFIVDGNNEFGIVNFPYNRPRPNDNDIPVEVADYLGLNLYGMPLIHTGGNYMTDGWGVSSSTTLVYTENPITTDSIDILVDEYLGVTDYYCLDDPLGDYIEHIDCWGKFLDVDKVLIGQVPQSDPRYNDFEAVADFYANTECSYGYNYEVYRVNTPGTYPNTPYTNSVIVNNKVLVPITGHQLDDDALAVYEEAMPGYEIHGFMPGSEPWVNTDAIHCRTKGIVDTNMLRIKHLPLHGEVDFQNSYAVQATFKAYSGQPLYTDSLRLYYKVNNSNYQIVLFNQVLGNMYKANIPRQNEGDEIAYYIHAADQSGRSENHPFIGAPDPHLFTVGAHYMLSQNPDTLWYESGTQCEEGQYVKFYNNTTEPIEIENLTTEGSSAGFNWYIDPWSISLPYTLAPQDSLLLNVKIDMISGSSGDWLMDSLVAETAVDEYVAWLMFNNDLVGEKELAIDGNSLQVRPNPFTDKINLQLQLISGQSVKIDLISLDGTQFNLFNGTLDKGIHELNFEGIPAEEMKNGVYLLKVQAGEKMLVRKMLKY